MNLYKRSILVILSLFVFSVATENVLRSELTNDFIPVKYKEQQIDTDRIVTLQDRSDLPELFKTKSAEKREVISDSVLTDINGYRVQVFKSADMINSKNMESMYIEMFGEDEVKLIFEQPFYKIRIGNLRNREEGEDFQEILKRRGIRNTILVPDMVSVLMPVKKR